MMGCLQWCLLYIICTSCLVQAEVCRSALGMEDGSIDDEELTASSAVSGLASAKHGRLNSNIEPGYGAWCPQQNKRWYGNKNSGPHYNQYFQIDLGKPVRIVAVGTQGRSKNSGFEGVAHFYVKYRTMSTGGMIQWMWYHNWMEPKAKRFFGNKDNMNVTVVNYFTPPIIVDKFRLVPEIYPVNQVCLRMELYGCKLEQDLVSYSLNPGDVHSPGINLTDLIFDGIITPSTLYTGLGYLTDGHLANKDFRLNNGRGWIGWNSQKTSSPSITFNFFKRRVFNSATLHCNLRQKSGIKLMKSLKVSFSDDGSTFHDHISYNSGEVSGGDRGMNYNVTVDLCKHYGKVVKMQFEYKGDWILVSEVIFDSDPVSGMQLPTPKCQPKPKPTAAAPVPTVLTTTGDNVTVIEPNDNTSTGGSLDDGAIIGIVCGVVLIVIILAIFLCWFFCRRKPNQKKPSFYNFIRWELKPYSSYQKDVRVSRLGSTGEELKNFTIKREEQNGDGVFDDGSAIYASIQNLEEAGKGPEYTIRPMGHKPGKPKNKPPPLPIPHQTDDHYALPDSPLLPDQPAIDEDGYCSPELKSPLLSPPRSPLPPKPDDPSDVFYAEPGSSPRPHTGGYSEPIDAVSPVEGIFRNPVYEEIYAEPYQGVSGTSLYANPATVLKVRRETFQEFPREKLFFKEKIGDGQFGEVHLGEAEGLWDSLGVEKNANKRVLVAIKKLKPEVDKNIKEDFFKEVKVMSGIQHENVIRLLGVCKDDPMCMIVEYMVNGDLNQFLKERELAPGTRGNKEKVLTYQALIYMASQVAAGMKYISSLKFVHRDLATRNCLVGHSYTVKIADFGMSRHLYSKHYYRVHGRVILPIRWMAPECILQGKFTSESDVWAFAVTLWEILTLAAEYPYNELTDEQVIENVQRMFFRPTCPKIEYLAKPAVCPDDVYDTMRACWQIDPDTRPDFNDLHGFVKSKVRMSEMAI